MLIIIVTIVFCIFRIYINTKSFPDEPAVFVTIRSFLYDKSDAFMELFIGIILSLLFACLIGWVLPSSRQNEAYEVKSLYAINNENSTDSLYYLDTSDNCIRYVTMTNNYKDEKVISKLPIMERVSIVEGEYNEPYLEIYKGKFEHKWYWLLGMDIRGLLGIDNYYIFYVPKGSIAYD